MNVDIVELVHKSYLRTNIGSRVGAHLHLCYMENLEERKLINNGVINGMMSYWISLDHAPDSKTAKLFLRLGKRLHDTDSISLPWIKCIKTNLDHLGLSYMWNSVVLANTKQAKSFINQTIKDQSLQKLELLTRNNRCATLYNMFKKKPGQECYLSLSAYFRKPLSRFRCGILRLHISEFKNLGTASCQYCGPDSIADEYHYLLVCPAFRYSRAQFLPVAFNSEPSLHKMHKLFNTQDKMVLKDLSRFVSFILDSLT